MRLRALCLGTLLGVGAAHSKPPHHFVLTSPDARLAVSVPESIPRRQFDCAGGNQSPALLWSGAPSGTQSFVVTLFDRDERSTPSGWWHWVVYDLPKNLDTLPMGAGTEHSQLLPADAQQGALISEPTPITARARQRLSTRISTSCRASRRQRVSNSSARVGSATPDGWLWASISAAALCLAFDSALPQLHTRKVRR